MGFLLAHYNRKSRLRLRILNPMEAKRKRGNGLRIFARYLFDQKKTDSFTVDTLVELYCEVSWTHLQYQSKWVR